MGDGVRYFVETEYLPGKWRPMPWLPYDRAYEAREACAALRSLQRKQRFRVARWKRDGLTGGKKGGDDE